MGCRETTTILETDILKDLNKKKAKMGTQLANHTVLYTLKYKATLSLGIATAFINPLASAHEHAQFMLHVGRTIITSHYFFNLLPPH